MQKTAPFEKNKIARNSVRKDMLFFGLPWAVIWAGGLWICIEDFLRQQDTILVFSVQSTGGLFLFILGLALLFTAKFTLRRSYAAVLIIWENHQLVTHGVYRYVRHPIYLGFILASIGIAVFASSVYGLLIMTVTIPVFCIRIRIEEKLLLDEFGGDYSVYKSRTKMLLPFIC